jgi:hypothetical protein
MAVTGKDGIGETVVEIRDESTETTTGTNQQMGWHKMQRQPSLDAVAKVRGTSGSVTSWEWMGRVGRGLDRHRGARGTREGANPAGPAASPTSSARRARQSAMIKDGVLLLDVLSVKGTCGVPGRGRNQSWDVSPFYCRQERAKWSP